MDGHVISSATQTSEGDSKMKRTYFRLLGAFVGFAAFLLVSAPALLAASKPPLGAAETFSVLAALSMSAAGAGTTVSGDLGLSPGLASSRTGPWSVGGTQYFGPLSLAATAQTDASAAFTNLAGQGSNGTWAASPWSPMPGVWTAASDTTFTGTITLSGSYTDVWVFQVGRDMTFSGKVIMAGHAQACNVFWQIGRDATIAVGSTFVGTLIASRDITVVSGATVDGRMISLTSSLTTDGNAITGPTCVAAPACVNPTLSALPSGTVGIPYSHTITATGGTPPYTWSSSGTLPGLTFDPTTQILSGTPTTAGTFTSLTITATDFVGCKGSVSAIVIGVCVDPTLSALPNGTVGIPYSHTITATGGTPPYIWSSSGTLPGLTFDPATQILSGTPTTAGTFTSLTITATDFVGCKGSVSSLVIGCPAITLTPDPLPPITVGTAYSQTITVVGGGPGPYDFTTAGALPAGLALIPATDTSVKITGTPTTAGPFSFQITAAQRSDHSCFATITYATSAYSPVGGPTLDSVGLAILILLLTGVGVLLVNRFTL
jgi:Ice-binding-like/Putative Ig domain